jgi:hypothetical protein
MVDRPLKVTVTFEHGDKVDSFSEMVPASFNATKVLDALRRSVHLESSMSAMQELVNDLGKRNARASKRLKWRD